MPDIAFHKCLPVPPVAGDEEQSESFIQVERAVEARLNSLLFTLRDLISFYDDQGTPTGISDNDFGDYLYMLSVQPAAKMIGASVPFWQLASPMGNEDIEAFHDFFGSASVYYVQARVAYASGKIDLCWPLIASAYKNAGSAEAARYVYSVLGRSVAYHGSNQRNTDDENFREMIRSKIIELASNLTDEALKELTVNKKITKRRKKSHGVKKLSRKSIVLAIQDPINELYRGKYGEAKNDLYGLIGQWMHSNPDFDKEIKSVIMKHRERVRKLRSVQP